MTIYNYLKEQDVQNDKYPLNTHLVFETADGVLYFVDSSNAKVLLKTTDEGETVTTVTTRTNKDIVRAWHDRDNEIIYFVDCDYDNTISYVWKLDYSSSDSITEITNIPADVFDIWIHNSKLYYYYYASSYELRSTFLEPDGDGSPLEWSSTGANHYTEIDEGATPVTSDYVYTNTLDDEDEYTFPDTLDLSSYDSGKVYGFNVWIYGRGGTIDVELWLIGTGQLGSTQQLVFAGDAWSWQSLSVSGLNLTDADVDNIEVIIRQESGEWMYWGYEDLTSDLTKRTDGICWDGTYFYVHEADNYVHKYSSSWVWQSKTWTAETSHDSLCWDGSAFYGVVGDEIKRYAGNFGAFPTTIDPSNVSYMFGVCWDGTYFYVVGYDGYVYKYNSSWVYQTSYNVGTSARDICWDGSTYFYIIHAPDEVKQYNTSFVVQNTWDVIYNAWGITESGTASTIYMGKYQGTNRYIFEYETYPTSKIATLRLEILFEGDTANELVVKNHTDTTTQEKDMGVVGERSWKSSQIIIEGSNMWFLWKWSDENSELWKHVLESSTFTEMEDCGSTTELPTTQQGGIAFDGDDTLSFVLGTGTAEVSTIVAQAASALSTGEYLTYSAIEIDSEGNRSEKEYYIWFNKDAGGGDPAPGGKTGIEVTITTGDTAQDVSDAIQSAVNADSIITCTNGGGTSTTCTLTCHYNGNTTNIADVDTGLSVATTTPGVANTYYYYTYGITGDDLTQGGEHNVALMLNRNTDTDNDPPFDLEKAFHLTNRYIYQIAMSKGNLYKIGDLTTTGTDGTIVGITDTYLFLKRTSNDIELWKLQDIGEHVLYTDFNHKERDYSVGNITYNHDEFAIEEGMFIQVIGKKTVNTTTSTGIIFEGYALEPQDYREDITSIKTVDIINPAKFDLENNSPNLDLSGDSDDYLDDFVDEWEYITKGIFDSGQTLGSIKFSSEKPYHTYVNQLAVGDEFTWRLRPQGEMDYTDGTDDSGINYSQATPVWDVQESIRTLIANKVTVRGAFVNNEQIVSDPSEDLGSQAINGIVAVEITIAWITTKALADTYAAALLSRLSAECKTIVFSVEDTTNGIILPAEEITFEYTPKSITSAQYKINEITHDDITNISEYTISSIVKWNLEDIAKDIQKEQSDQINQIAEHTKQGGNLPIGTILMFKGNGIKGGDTSNILTRTDEISIDNGDDFDMQGWYVCNGVSSTPNLHDRFIRCELDSAGGTVTGGADTHTLTIGEMPSHAHGYYRSSAGGITALIGCCGGFYYLENWVTSGYNGSGDAHNNMPSYFSVIFIIKMS